MILKNITSFVITITVADLFGMERKYMLAEMRPFIPEPNVPYFEQFLHQMVSNSTNSRNEDECHE